MIYQHGTLLIKQVPCLPQNQNYGYLVHDEESGQTTSIDSPDPDVLAQALAEEGWGLDFIWNTHKHWDHVDGNPALKDKFRCQVIGPAGEGDAIKQIDRAVSEGDEVTLGAHVFRVMETPGHTLGHIIYVCDTLKIAFVGDTLFSLGCGRMFEGTPDMFWSSLDRIRQLPPETQIYCAHEYTEANYRFAISVDPENTALLERGREVLALRREDQPTVPVSLAVELKTNPFLRADDPRLMVAMGKETAVPADVFGAIRAAKDKF